MSLELYPQAMTCVYRLYDVTDRLLYVGVAYDFDVRFKTHARQKDWWPQVARKDIIWFANRIDALHEEARAIATENPIHNIDEGAHPIGLAVIYRQHPRGYNRPRGWDFTARHETVMLSQYEKRKILEEVITFKSHAVVTVEGEPVGVAIPTDWYLRAREALGQGAPPEESPQVERDVFWRPYDLSRT